MATKTLNVLITGNPAGLMTAFKTSGAGAGAFAAKLASASVAISAAMGVAAAAVGVAAFKMGRDFDKAYDKIRVGTGATGDSLDGLKDDFKTVLAEGPHSMDAVSSAVADLNTRLGLTGAPLQELSTQILDLSRITGTDAATNVDKITRMFGDWNVSAEEMSGQLDELYRAAQNSGAGVDDLASNLVQFGAPLRNMGFELDTATALLATFDKEGVNMEAVMAGMKIGVGNLAKAGEDIPTTFSRVVDEIAAMGPSAEATGKAIELFGSRSGPDLADAITGGKFAIEDMLAAITGGEDTIQKAADDTESFGEKWDTLKNKISVAVEPAVSAFFEKLSSGMEKLIPLARKARDRIAELVDWFKDNPAALAAVATFFGTTLVVAFGAAAVAAWSLAAGVIAATWPILAIGAALGLVAAALVWAYFNFDEFRAIVDIAADVVQRAIPLVGSHLAAAFGALTTAVAIATGAFRVLYGVIDRNVLPVLLKLAGILAGALQSGWNVAWAGGTMFRTGLDLLVGALRGTYRAAEVLARFLPGGFAGGMAVAVGPVHVLASMLGRLVGMLNSISSAANAAVRAIGRIKAPSLPSLPSWVPGFAAGGNPPVGTPYLVGENGPELRIDHTPGTIIPNHKLTMPSAGGSSAGPAMSGGGVTVVVNVAGHVRADDDLADMIRNKLIDTGRRTGRPVLGGF